MSIVDKQVNKVTRADRSTGARHTTPKKERWFDFMLGGKKTKRRIHTREDDWGFDDDLLDEEDASATPEDSEDFDEEPAPRPKHAAPASKPASEPPKPAATEPKPEPKPAAKPAEKPATPPASEPDDDEPYRRPPTPSFAPRMATRTPTYPETDQQVVALFRSLQSKNVAYGAGIFVDDYGRLLPINLMSLSPEMLEIHEIIEEHYYAPAVRKNVAPFWNKLPGMDYAMSIQSILKAREDFGWNPGRLSLTDKNCRFCVLTSDGKIDSTATKERPVTDAEITAWEDTHADLLAKLNG